MVSIAAYAVRPDSVVVTAETIEVHVGLPWYRSLPWAGVAGVELEIDGSPVEGAEATIDGYRPEELASREDYWHIQHRAVVVFPRGGAGTVSGPVPVVVRVHLRVPGPLLPDGSPMPFTFEDRRILAVQHS